MKVFLSWSGDLSHSVACILRDWLSAVIQAVEPYVSSEDIEKGARWSSDVAHRLEESAFGIICVTRENVTAPWINFEAGVLSKSLNESFVSPFLFRIKRSEIQGPLLQFQSTIFEEKDVFKLLGSINARLGDARLSDGKLRRSFDIWWPGLASRLEALGEDLSSPPPTDTKISQDQILEELLELARNQAKLLRTLPDPQDSEERLSTLIQSTLDANLRDVRLLGRLLTDTQIIRDAFGKTELSDALMVKLGRDSTLIDSLELMIDGLSRLQASTHWAKDAYREYLAAVIETASKNSLALSDLTKNLSPSIWEINMVSRAQRTDEILLTLMARMQRGCRYIAVSDVGSWLDDKLERFFHENCAAAKRGVLIRRIFVVLDEEIRSGAVTPESAYRELERHFRVQSGQNNTGYQIRLYQSPLRLHLANEKLELLGEHFGIFVPVGDEPGVQVTVARTNLSRLKLMNVSRTAAIHRDFDAIWNALESDLTMDMLKQARDRWTEIAKTGTSE